MNKKLNKLKVKAILPAAALLAAAAIGTTFAWQTWDMSVTNQLKAHDTEVSVKESFDKQIKKNVYFKNEGSSSVFLRVAFTEYWEKDGIILPNKADGTSVAAKEWGYDWENSIRWTHSEDGWSYYNYSLKPGTTTDYILLSATSDSAVLPDTYQNAEYHLYFKAEVVQCSDGANTLNSDEVNVAAINEIFEKSLTASALRKTGMVVDGGVTAEVYQIDWPDAVAWKDFKGGQKE